MKECLLIITFIAGCIGHDLDIKRVCERGGVLHLLTSDKEFRCIEVVDK